MKKNILLIIICLLSSINIIQAEIFEIEIMNFKGNVTVVQDAKNIKVEKGMKVKQGDEIVTGEKSFCDIKYGESTYNRIGQNTEVKIDKAEYKKKFTIFGFKNKKDIQLNIKKGELLSKLKKLAGRDSYKIKTPTAVCGVRGTIFNTSVSPVGATNISVFQGAVSVVSRISGAVKNVSAGQTVNVAPAPEETQSEESSSAEMKVTAIQTEEQSSAAAEVKEIISQPVESVEQVNVTEQLINNTSSPVENIETVKEQIIQTKTTQSDNVIINFK